LAGVRGGRGEGLPDSCSRVICPPPAPRPPHGMCLTFCSHAMNLPAANFCRGNESQRKQRRNQSCDCSIRLEMYSDVQIVLDWTGLPIIPVWARRVLGGLGKAELAERTIRICISFLKFCQRTKGLLPDIFYLSIRFYNSCRPLPQTKHHSSLFLH
jgi:hypothetical protein